MSTTDNTSRKVARNVKRTKGEKVERIPEDSVVHFFNTRGSNRRNAWQETGAEWKTWWTTKPVFCQGHNWIPIKNNRYWRAFLGRQGHKWVPAKGNSQRLAVIYAYRYEWVPRASVIWASVHMHLDKRHESVHVLQMLLSTQAQANWSANWCAAPCTLWCYLLPPGAEYVENQSWRSLLLSAASECLLPFKENMCVKEKQTLCHRRSMC